MFQFLKKPLALTHKSVTVTPMKVSNLCVSPTYNNPLPSNPVHLASALTGKTVRYENKNHKSTVTIDGQTEDVYGTACREPDGSWRFVN